MENNMIYEAAKDYKILEVYEEASESTVKEIRRLLKQQNLNKNINIKYDNIELEVNFNNLSKYYPSKKLRSFYMDDDINAIRFENKPVMLYMYIGHWSNNNNARIKNSHISIYTNSSKIGGERFFQIELSDCIEDDKYVYILKNISKNAGNGAISRLNKYSYPTTEREKRNNDLRERREELIRRTYSEVINYNNNDWICIYKFDKEKLFKLSYHEELFNECIESIIAFTFSMESIVVEAKKFGNFIQTVPSIEKLPQKALLRQIKKVNKIPKKIEKTYTSYVRNEYITEYAKRRANGTCQLCRKEAPFKDKNGRPYLEVHHIVPLSEGGEDSIENTVALCPNCHRKMHSLGDVKDVKYLNNINSFDYILLSECAIDIGLEAYNIKICSDGKIEGQIYNKRTRSSSSISNKKYLSIDTIMNISKEIKDFDLKNFELVEPEYYKTCQPVFYIEVKYSDDTIKEIYYDYGKIYENKLDKNKIDILKLKHNLEQILNIKSLDNLMKR